MANISGWYYDLQQQYDTVARMSTVSLHANSKYVGKDQWVYTEPGKKTSEYGDIDDDGYYVKPLCTAILTDEFNVSANNSWSDMGEDFLGGVWNNVRKLAPYAGTVVKGLTDIVKSQDQMSQKDKEEMAGSVAGSAMMWIAQQAHKLVGGKGVNGGVADNGANGEAFMSKYLNSAVQMQGSRYTQYMGSNLNFSNMSMRFTLIPNWDENGKFHTVHNQLKELYPYFFGEYIPADFSGLVDNENIQKMLDKAAKEITWQRPPGGYQADLDNLDATQKGSLKLKFGAYYSMCNVVVDNISLNFSKQLVKNPMAAYDNLGEGNGAFGDDLDSQFISPMSCDINLTLRPCTKYSDTALRNSLEGRGMLTELNQLTSTLQKNLNEEMKATSLDFTGTDGTTELNLESPSQLYIDKSAKLAKKNEKIQKKKEKQAEREKKAKEREAEREKRKTARLNSKTKKETEKADKKAVKEGAKQAKIDIKEAVENPEIEEVDPETEAALAQYQAEQEAVKAQNEFNKAQEIVNKTKEAKEAESTAAKELKEEAKTAKELAREEAKKEAEYLKNLNKINKFANKVLETMSKEQSKEILSELKDATKTQEKSSN